MATTALFRLSLGTRTGSTVPNTPHVVETDVSFVLLALDECSEAALTDARLTAAQWGCAWCEMLLACDLIDVFNWEE